MEVILALMLKTIFILVICEIHYFIRERSLDKIQQDFLEKLDRQTVEIVQGESKATFNKIFSKWS